MAVAVPAAPSGSMTSSRTSREAPAGTRVAQVVAPSGVAVAVGQASASPTYQRVRSVSAAWLGSLAWPRSVTVVPSSTVLPSVGAVICASGSAFVFVRLPSLQAASTLTEAIDRTRIVRQGNVIMVPA